MDTQQPTTLAESRTAPIVVGSGDLLAVLDADEVKAWEEYMAATDKFEADTKAQRQTVKDAEQKWMAAFTALKVHKKQSTANRELCRDASKTKSDKYDK